MIKLFESFQTEEEIQELCIKYRIKNYIINSDSSISVDNDVNLYNRFLTKIPLNFKRVDGEFSCDVNELTSLNGCPEVITRYFDCSENKLTSLIGGPKNVGGYYCNENEIVTFQGFPDSVEVFFCDNNPIYNIWKLFNDVNKVELLNEMNPLRVIGVRPHVVIDILNDFLSIIGKKEVRKIKGYINV